MYKYELRDNLFKLSGELTRHFDLRRRRSPLSILNLCYEGETVAARCCMLSSCISNQLSTFDVRDNYRIAQKRLQNSHVHIVHNSTLQKRQNHV